MRIATTAVVAALALAGCGGGDDGAGADQAASESGSGAGGLPDGEYLCSYNSGGMLMTLGAVTIRGNRYSGFSGGRFSPYSRTQETLNFPAGFVGVPDGYTVVESRYLMGSDGEPFIEISYGSPSGWRDTWTCSIE